MWQEIEVPDDIEANLALERAGFIVTMSGDGMSHTWHLYRRTGAAVDRLHEAGVWSQFGHLDIQNGVNWADSQIITQGL